MKPIFRLGLTGAQGSGKSTLAKTFSEQIGIRYFDANVRGILKRNGFDCRSEMTLKQYFNMQETVVHELYSSYPDESFITDRTPIDVMAFTLAYVPPTIVEGSEDGKSIEFSLLDILTESRLAVTQHFSHIILVHGGFKVDEEDMKRKDRASMHLGYRMKLESLIEGELGRFSNFSSTKGVEFRMIPRDMTGLQRRVNSLIGVYARYIDSFNYETSTAH
ncbi:AAA family ATPase [Xenorhabdus sp. KJ12.1]|uniref:AAA family ATPase n=1 Tax=Xenorhabdus sp. KJ12.1 TaxID=1851571 RepID=UPI000C042668|nr:AAA family ATPase [Xenorhabdus sp. KJ12.1]PHM69523.1 Dephospho-CoA kinase [Xenorhabdus sp. KJ12.1]